MTITIPLEQIDDNPWRRGYRGTLEHVVPFNHPRLNDMHRAYALVPMVPADVRPNVNLKKCFILWEVEHWSDNPLTALPPRDPYLLRHLAGDLYVVLAEWELTALERAIMTGRRAN